MATINGAGAVGLSDRIGSLEIGKRADLVVRREDLPEARPDKVDGKVIVEKGHLTRVDEEEVYVRSREATRRLVERRDSPPLSPRWPHID